MSMYGWKCQEIVEWLKLREAELNHAWCIAVYEVIRCSPWTMEMNVRIDDTVDKQARAERLGYICDQPIPSDGKPRPSRGEHELPPLRGTPAPPSLEDLPF
jgi:hypothetical protein